MEDGIGERREVEGQPVVITQPKGKPSGLTFILTAANIPLSKYNSIRDALLSSDQVVVGFYINVLNPPRNNHRVKAEMVWKIFRKLKVEFNMEQYNIVGHSIGGKIALLVAACFDEYKYVRAIVALDPVDQTPVEFTNADSRKNISLHGVKVPITLTFTDSGFFVSKNHNAREIQRINPELKLVNHRNAGHMAYCDEGGQLSWKMAMRPASEAYSEAAKKEALTIIKDMTKTAAGRLLKNAKKAVTGEVMSVKDGMKSATSEAQGAAKGGMAKMFLKSSLGL